MITITPNMLVGIPKVDAEHQELINRLNADSSMGVHAVSDEETKKTIDLLGDYIVKHFNDEEVLQKQSGYSKYEWHHAQHQLYIEEFKKLKAEFLAHGTSAAFTLALNNSIINWIVKHIKSVDVEFGKYYNSVKK